MAAFSDDWRRSYGDAPPLGYILREQFSPRWARLHALPHSKRYAESQEESALILQRANALATDLFGHDGPCWMVQACAADDAPDPALSFSYAFDNDDMHWRVFAQDVTFQAGSFDSNFLRIAEDAAPRTLWFSARDGRVFAPYDGGFDLILETGNAAADFKRRYHFWRSPRADGL